MAFPQWETLLVWTMAGCGARMIPRVWLWVLGAVTLGALAAVALTEGHRAPLPVPEPILETPAPPKPRRRHRRVHPLPAPAPVAPPVEPIALVVEPEPPEPAASPTP